ncbi:uncharacterized protein LOC144568581 [Carex rostrata]
MGRQRSNASSDLDEERARKRIRVYDKDRIGSAMERKKKDRRDDPRHGRVVDLNKGMNLRHGISGGQRYKEGKERVSKRYKDERVREPVNRSRGLSICGGEDCRGEKRMYADIGNSADLKGTSKVMRGELDKHVPRHGHRKVEYLSSDNFHKRVSNSESILGQIRYSNLIFFLA